MSVVPPIHSGVSPSTLFMTLSIAAQRASAETLPHVARESVQIARLLADIRSSNSRTGIKLASLQDLARSSHLEANGLGLRLNGMSSDQALTEGFLHAVDPELAVQLRKQAFALQDPARSTERHEIDAVRTSLMITDDELQQIERQPHAAHYPGIRQYRKAVSGRLKDLKRIEEALTPVTQDKPLSPRLQDRWERLRMSYLGEKENGYRSKVQQHLDLLRQVQAASGGIQGDPLLKEMLARQGEYLELLAEIAKAERQENALRLTLLQDRKYNLEHSYHEAVEAFYFLKGYMPTSWRGSFQEMTRDFRLNQPSSWVPPLLLGGLTAFISSFQIEPLSYDGAVFPAVRKRWEGGTLVIEPVYPTKRTGLSQRALGSGLLETLRVQLALVNTADIDPTHGNFGGLMSAWLQQVLTLSGTTLKVEGLENLKGFRDQNLILAPTHRGFAEYPILLGLQDEIGRTYRMIAKEEFWTNPLIRGLVGLAMVRYNFFLIDRSAGANAKKTMEEAGRQVGDGKRSILTFSSASRSRTLVFEGERVEGPHHAAKHGIGYMSIAAGDAWIVPIAVINSGVLTPKAVGEQARGILTGQTVTVRIGRPFRGSSLRTAEMNDAAHAREIAAKIDEAFRELTGLPTGPLYAEKGPKTIFQADDLTSFEIEMRKRLKNPNRYHHSAVVFSPKTPYEFGEEGAIFQRLSRLKFPVQRRLTVFHAVKVPDGYRFDSYDVVRTGNSGNLTTDFQVIRRDPTASVDLQQPSP